MKITAILCALLALASGGLLWQTHQRGKDSARNEALSREVKSNGEVLDELRALTADAREVLAQLRATEQQRNAEGEKRRENMRDAIKDDTCANTVVPASVSNSLQYRTASATNENRVRTGAGKPDGSNASAGTDRPGNVGRDSHLE
ncbi:DUF2570 domain-containing protein [Enterobacter hormaechei subsp. hoffmannii]|uniref:DUF2570 domain-containing protein n=1 Tax=Enterobacter hormaechei TaxID=158836 RepID=UPI001BDF935F|nr:DUF2570 domain-containing protein [Enterobacter hormaechei]MBT2055831.1 DUF2570 domain-containing protein [Enterobacter hormaechei subsp. hoffmannii]